MSNLDCRTTSRFASTPFTSWTTAGTRRSILDNRITAFTDIRSGTDPGPDNKFGTSDDKTVYVYSIPSGVAIQVNQKVVNYDKNERNRLYTAYETSVNKRYSNGWTLLAGYTLDYQKVSNEIPVNPNQALYNLQTPYWSKSLKMSASYDLPIWGLKWGSTYNAQSGDPYARTVSLRDGRGIERQPARRRYRGSLSVGEVVGQPRFEGFQDRRQADDRSAVGFVQHPEHLGAAELADVADGGGDRFGRAILQLRFGLVPQAHRDRRYRCIGSLADHFAADLPPGRPLSLLTFSP